MLNYPSHRSTQRNSTNLCPGLGVPLLRGTGRGALSRDVGGFEMRWALQDIPVGRIEKYLVNDAPERLLKSLSRRLGFLDGSSERSIMRRVSVMAHGPFDG